MKKKDINQADLVGEKKTKITQDYDFIKEIGAGTVNIFTNNNYRCFWKSLQGRT